MGLYETAWDTDTIGDIVRRYETLWGTETPWDIIIIIIIIKYTTHQYYE